MSVAFSNLPAGVVRAGEGERHGVIGHTIIFKSLGKELGGAAFAWETQSPPGTMVPPHTHSVEDELIYVVEGQLEATVGDQAYTLRAGDLVKMLRGVPHGIRMAENQSTKTLWTVVPAGKMEGLFQALGTLPANQPPDLAQITRIFSDHDIELLPPPAA